MANFSVGDLRSWASKTEIRMEAVVKTSLQDAVDEMQEPRAKGGRMPVDTGFMRNSAGAALNALPSSNGDYSQGATAVVINRLKIGDTFYFGWAANYAPFMNNRYGFLDLPVQNWDNIVIKAIKKVRGNG